MGVSKNRGKNPPKWMVNIMVNPVNKWMIWVVFPYFWFNTHMDFPSDGLVPETAGQVGSIVGAFVCTRTDAELRKELEGLEEPV